MFRIKKGHHGYIKRKKRLLLGEVLGLLIGIIGLVVIGVVTTGSRKNLLTVVAMVSVIPMVNQLVILIALWKYQPCPDKEYEQVASLVGKGIMRVFTRKAFFAIALIRMYQKKRQLSI